MKKFFSFTFVPLKADLGLLLFRAVLAWLVLRYHGWGKLTGWKDEPAHLPNFFAIEGVKKEFHTFPNYIGISSELSYVLVTWFETFGCIMIICGLFARFNAFGMFFTLMVAWYFHHHMALSGPNSGEVAFAYAFGFLLIVLAGPGKYAVQTESGHSKE